MPKSKIAIIAWGAMADVLYATPIVRKIRRMNPDNHLVWLIRDKFSDVVQGNKDVDEIRTFKLPDGYDSRQDAEYVMDKEILTYAQGDEFDWFYDLQYWPRYANFYEKPQEDFITLRSRNAGIDPPKNRQIELQWSREDERQNMHWMIEKQIYNGERSFITCNHISYAASKMWAFDNYEQLVALLDKQGIASVFTGAANEPIPEGAIDARGMPYRQWAIVIRASNLWLGLDSGAVALACASDVPIIKLHSPDFPLAKTGIKSMGLRQDNVLELCPAPNVETMTELIIDNMRGNKNAGN